jgi:hypothetical protein
MNDDRYRRQDIIETNANSGRVIVSPLDSSRIAADWPAPHALDADSDSLGAAAGIIDKSTAVSHRVYICIHILICCLPALTLMGWMPFFWGCSLYPPICSGSHSTLTLFLWRTARACRHRHCRRTNNNKKPP